jgi:hypothetical protein
MSVVQVNFNFVAPFDPSSTVLAWARDITH